MKTLVTGATGFIGSNLVDTLLAMGRRVRILVKAKNDIKGLDKNGNIEVAYGDLTQKKTLASATEGINIVYHLGALLPYEYHTRQAYYLVNVLGTKNLLEACEARDIKKFIYFSSISAVGPSYQPVPVEEDSACHPLTTYGISKYLSERIALDFFQEKKVPVVVIRTPLVYGPGDINGLLRIFQLIQKKLFVSIRPMRDKIRSFCYVGNLIDASLKAEISSCAAGNMYFISDQEQYRLGEFIDAVSKELGVRLFNIELPLSLGKIMGGACEIWSRLLKKKPFVTREMVQRLCAEYELCDIAKARAQLSYSPRYSLAQGISRTIAWYRQKGFLH